MSEEEKDMARKEIRETLRVCNLCIRPTGLSFIDDAPKSLYDKFVNVFSIALCSFLLVWMLVGEYVYIVIQTLNLPSIEQLIGSYLHITGYDTLSFSKFITIWYKRQTFKKLVGELADIWPVLLTDKEAANIKQTSLSALKKTQNLYAFWNIFGVWMYNLTPIVILVYHKLTGVPAQLGYVWQMSYPFDKTKPVYHELVYIFETYSGIMSVCCMLGSDLLFMTMASHISMLLRLLQVKIRHLITLDTDDTALASVRSYDCYQEIVSVVKVHQRLINYISDLEDAFSAVNLINVLLSSVNICCVVFAIVFLDPWVEVGNKFYVGAALTQMGIVCWYADDICRASIGVSDAVYESGWYRCNVRSQRALLVMLQRSQKPLCFTALKFRAITMATYSSILTTAYSYFTLLAASYR